MDHDMELLREYAARRSEQAFATLVARHISLVHSSALRQVRDPVLADEITQEVFITLARKATLIHPKTILPGWLYRTTRFTAANVLRTESSRQRREQEAQMQSTIDNNSAEAVWQELSPILDEAMSRLGQADRDALLLRYFENRSMREVGAALGTNEEAARKRVARGLDKLRLFFTKRCVSPTTAMIAGAISANSIQAAPTGLANSVTAAAIAKGATATGSTLTLIKGALKLMVWTKAKTAVVAAAALVVSGTAVVTVKGIAYYREESVWSHITAADQRHLHAAPPIVSIRRSKPHPRFGTAWISDGRKQMAFNKSVGKLLQNAYLIREPRIVYSGKPPEGTYDYIVTVPDHQLQALQAAIKKKFGLVGRKEMRDTDVLVLRVARQNAPGLKSTPEPRAINLNNASAGQFIIRNEPMANITHSLELYLKTPLIDETGLTGRYDVELTWDATEQDYNPDGMRQAILDQLGLELVADHQTIEVLVVEKEK